DGPGSRPWKSDTCGDCNHYQGFQRCAAFPDGIPNALWQAYKGHRTPWPGDQGIQYEQVPMPTGPIDIPEFLKRKA
ncbi:MAG: hypothetical protein LWW92_17855, partial [Rhodocyclales bacterium]|nr:hypothetical protein [Rhodocyclales bacterium]